MIENSLTLTEYLAQVKAGTLDPQTVVLQYMEKIKKENAELFSFVRIHEKYLEQHLPQLIQ
jgi:Asp-tRNA(Asn)/Glu-tRNA(Gln) amidotransferase A subunit family amidase